MAEALTDYQNRRLSTEAIAVKHSISTATLTVWAKKAGIPLRQRGRKPQENPTTRQKEILKLASVLSQAKVGERFGMHKQSIHRIVKRWRDWFQSKQAPFDPGDMVSWRGRRFTVLEANHEDGTLLDDDGKKYKNFTWNGGRMPKKIGVNPRYAKPKGAVGA